VNILRSPSGCSHSQRSSRPIRQAERKVVPYKVATDMDSPNPDSGEEYPHTNTQLYNILSEENRFKVGEDITAPWNAPEPGQTPTMNGYVTDYISTLTAELGRQPTYEEYCRS
jgi:phospholipase C